MPQRRIIPQEEIEARTLVIHEATTFRDALERLTALGYPCKIDALQQWARHNIKYVPPSVFERLLTRPPETIQRIRAAQAGRIATRRMKVELKQARDTKSSPVVYRTVEEVSAPKLPDKLTTTEIGEAIVAKIADLRKQISGLQLQLADKNEVIRNLNSQLLTRETENKQQRDRILWLQLEAEKAKSEAVVARQGESMSLRELLR